MPSNPTPTLKQLSKDTDALCNVINDEPDLACVLITASFLDQCLASLLLEHLVKGSTTENLLNFKGAIGSYANRVNLCYCLGIITKGMKQNLDTIGEIRNRFGHSHLSIKFSDEGIGKLCGKLTPPTVHKIGGDTHTKELLTNMNGARSRFTIIAFLLAHRLILTGLSIKQIDGRTTGWE